MQEQSLSTSSLSESSRASWPVALVSMPFLSAKRPSIQLGLLKSIVDGYGFPATTFHLNLDFAVKIGQSTYEILCGHRGMQIGDWLFSTAAFGGNAPDPDSRLLNDFDSAIADLLSDLGETQEYLLSLRDRVVPRYLDELMDSINWNDFRVIGFTSTFQQNVASFALAARIKRRFPGVCTVFGGANFDGEMGEELVRVMNCIDYAISGEADLALPEFLVALGEQRDPATVPGVVCRRNGTVSVSPPRPLLRDLDALPIPDYREFFDRVESLGLKQDYTGAPAYIPFESARGCWWGQKHHCTFCGLNGLGMPFRAKTSPRLLDELAELVRRHHIFYFEAVDNILDMSYLDSVFAEVVKAGIDYRFFYEVKANLTRQQLKLLRDAGVHRIQPGIESLSTHVLQLMRKGVTAIQNINLLRWALYYRIHVSWNIIWGFPHETQADYDNQLILLRQLVHLPPPHSAGRVWLERFSPLFFDRANYPATSVHPERSYRYVYPGYVQLDRAAYFFDYELEASLPDSAYAETLRQVEHWRSAWQGDTHPRLSFWHSPGVLIIDDTRDREAPRKWSFVDPEATLYAACSDRPRSAASLKRTQDLGLPEDEIQDALCRLCAHGVMMREGNQFLSLGLPASIGR